MIDLFKNVSLYIVRKMCIKSIEVCPCLIGAVPDQCRTKEMRKKAVEKKPWSLKFVPGLRRRRCVKKQLRNAHGDWNLSQIILRWRRCVKKQLRKKHGYWNLYKGCVTRWCRNYYTQWSMSPIGSFYKSN